MDAVEAAVAGSQQNLRGGQSGHGGAGEQTGTGAAGNASTTAHGSSGAGAANSPYKVPRSVSAQAAPSGPKRRLSSGDQQNQGAVPPAVGGGAPVAVVPGAVVLPAGAMIGQGANSNVVPLRQNPRTAVAASMGPAGQGECFLSRITFLHEVCV